MWSIRTRVAASVLTLLVVTAWAQNTGALRGRIFDEKGGVIVGAQVKLVSSAGVEKATVTDGEGWYSFTGLAPDIYTLSAGAEGFAVHENLAQIPAGQPAPVMLDIKLAVAIAGQEVTITSEAAALSVDAANNAGAIILKGEDLEALPEDPEELADFLQALAGPTAGPSGGQFFIDGFSGGRLPPRAAIREVRINQNPFSSEFERLGFGRIEIFTRPGTDKVRGQFFYNFNDESLNSRHPFAPHRAPFQLRQYGGHLSGPLAAKKASFFLNFDRREIDENAVINATILDRNLSPFRFSQAVVTPQRRSGFSSRLDYQLHEMHTLVARYGTSGGRQEQEGIGEFSLLSRAYNASSREHEFRVTETAILGSSLINETRFGYEFNRRDRQGDNTIPTIRVLDAFTGGGSQVGLSLNKSRQWELHNSTSWIRGSHSVKFGARLRGSSIEDATRSNFGGTFTFAGGGAPQLEENHQVVLVNGKPVLVPITSLERYRRTLLFQQLGKTPTEIRALGGGATQFSIAGGDPFADVRQVDVAGFFQEDWRISQNMLLSLGLRYEGQTNIPDKLDLAPRVGLAWSPGAKRGFRPKTILRAGFGLFYDRFNQSFTLEADRYNGVKQAQFIVSNPDFFPIVPSVEDLLAAARPQTTRRVSSDLQSPYSMQTALSVERQLPLNFTLSASYVKVRMLHTLRSVNVNAPLPDSGVRPLGNIGNVFEYRADGVFNQEQLIIGVNNRFSSKLTLFGHYMLGKANSDTDGAGTFPAHPHDFSGEYGRAAMDVRHRVTVGGSITVPGNIRLNPFVTASSGRPFNITTGRDTNGDALFTERPAVATDLNKPGVILTRFGAFDPSPEPGQPIIPRNAGQGPGFVLVRLRISKTFGFGGGAEPASAGTPGARPPGQWAGGGMRGGGPGGGHGSGGDLWGGGGSGKPYNLTFSVDVTNVFNHTNLGNFVGNLSSPLFGQANSTMAGFGFRGPGGGGGGLSAAGNRRIELQLRFSF